MAVFQNIKNIFQIIFWRERKERKANNNTLDEYSRTSTATLQLKLLTLVCWVPPVRNGLGFPDAPSSGMRTRRRLTVVNRRQKGVFAPSQNKTKQVEKSPNERTFTRLRRLKVAQKSPANVNGHFGEVTGGIGWTFYRTVNSAVAAAAA